MPRSYLINLLVEVHVDNEDWDELESVLEDRMLWWLTHTPGVITPYIISAEIESCAEEAEDGVYYHN